ncbi:hypothetical protein QE152_g4640 [Popillia japonica]|uniref:Uncharacterized protein n=1 Tax=Popillia japonica TaxID=7064 RepID=A0AAW1MWH5_POPJA
MPKYPAKVLNETQTQLIKKNNSTTKTDKCQNPAFGADHTVLSGVAIDWGHGWGWGCTAWTSQAAACSHEVPVTSVYCNGEDYGVEGYNEVDWSSFGDFCF